MSGNWATGIAEMAMSPARVMTIAMTKASRGRSTKMAEIMRSASRAGRALAGLTGGVNWRALRGLPGDLNDLARPYLLHAVDDDLLALLDAVLDDDVGALGRPGGDPALLDLVIGAHHQHVGAGLIDLQRRLRHDEARLLLALLDHDRDELPVDELALGIGQGRAHGPRVGRLVDLRIGVVPHPGMRIVLAGRQAHQDFDLAYRSVLLLALRTDVLELALAHREEDVDRVLADDGVQHATRRVDEVALGIAGDD